MSTLKNKIITISNGVITVNNKISTGCGGACWDGNPTIFYSSVLVDVTGSWDFSTCDAPTVACGGSVTSIVVPAVGSNYATGTPAGCVDSQQAYGVSLQVGNDGISSCWFWQVVVQFTQASPFTTVYQVAYQKTTSDPDPKGTYVFLSSGCATASVPPTVTVS